MTIEKKLKDPDSVLDYGFDWAAWLVDDTIADSAWLINDGADPGDDTEYLTIDTDSNDTTTTTVWLSKGGTAGTIYLVTNRITTDAGRTQDQTMKIQIKEL